MRPRPLYVLPLVLILALVAVPVGAGPGKAAKKKKPAPRPAAQRLQQAQRTLQQRQKQQKKAESRLEQSQRKLTRQVGKDASRQSLKSTRKTIVKRTSELRRKNRLVRKSKATVKKLKKKVGKPGKGPQPLPEEEMVPGEEEWTEEPLPEEWFDAPFPEDGLDPFADPFAAPEPADPAADDVVDDLAGDLQDQAASGGTLLDVLSALGAYLRDNPRAAAAVARAISALVETAPDDATRTGAVEAIDLYRAPTETVEQVAARLADPSAEVRAAAAAALGDVDPRDRAMALERLEAAYRAETDLEVRSAILAAIVRAGRLEASAILARLTEEDPGLLARIEDYRAVLATGEVDIDRIEAEVERRAEERGGAEAGSVATGGNAAPASSASGPSPAVGSGSWLGQKRNELESRLREERARLLGR